MGAPAFTSETGRLAARKSAEVRRERSRLPALPAFEPALLLDHYSRDRLERVRKALRNLETLLLAERDAQKISWLSASLDKLSEIERQLSGRSLPPTLKPVREAQRPVAMVDVQPIAELQPPSITAPSAAPAVPLPVPYPSPR